MKYTDYLEKMKGFSYRTIEIYNKWALELRNYNLDYKIMISSLPSYSANTMRLIISSIISYYKYIGDNRYKELELPKKEIKVQEYISFEQYQSFLKSINNKTKKGALRRLVVRLLFETGIRSSELLSIKRNDIQGNWIKIHGKGKKERIVKLSPWLLDELEQYIRNSKKEDILFEFGYKNLYAKIAILDRRIRITPHMFRRGFAKYCHEKGVSILDISLAMGHSSIETTAGYIKKKSDDVEIHQIF